MLGGVLMAIDSNFEHIMHEKITSIDGRYIILDIEFFLNLFKEIEQRKVKNIIMTGDWNMVIDFNTLNYKKLNNPKSNKIVIENEKINWI